MKLSKFLTEYEQYSLEQQILYLNNKTEFSSDELHEAIISIKEANKIENKTVNALDICGTGGNKKARINSSSLIAFLLSAKGIKVLKHGNKAQTGRVGGFDFLSKIGIEPHEFSLEIYNRLNLEFLFAPSYYKSFANLKEARTQHGKFSFMNVLGPLLNPYNPKYQMIGCSSEKHLKAVIETCKKLGKKSALVFEDNARDDIYLDKSTKKGFLLLNGKINKFDFTLEKFNEKVCEYYKLPNDIIGFQIDLMKGLLNISDVYCKHIALNASLAEFLTNQNIDLTKTYNDNLKLIKSGLIYQHYLKYKQASNSENVLRKVILSKIDEIKYSPKISLKENLKRKTINIIAEIKFRSPSSPNGFLNSKKTVSDLALKYSQNKNVVGISHVVDKVSFGGDLKNIATIKSIAPNLPVIYKDFIVCEKQILKAADSGADVILLIRKLLTDSEIKSLTDCAQKNSLEVILELENCEQIKKYQKFKCDILGVNSRSLADYKFLDSKFKNPANCSKPVIYESGINTYKDIKTNPANGYLIGTSLMESPSISLKLLELTNVPILKICGVRENEIIKQISNLSIELIGINFVSYSKRKVDLKLSNKFLKLNKLKVGLFDSESIHLAKKYIKMFGLNYIQTSKDINQLNLSSLKVPVIPCFNLTDSNDATEINKSKNEIIIVDSAQSGSGQTAPTSLIKKINRPFILAGGINEKNIIRLKNLNPNCIGVDIASGVEENGNQSIDRIEKIINLLKI